MARRRILTVIGARPQFIKASLLSSLIKSEYADFFEEEIVHTGQHYDYNMSERFFSDLQIPAPIVNLNINGQNAAAMTGEMLMRLEAVLQQKKPDLVLVYGDTNSTMAGAMAAAHLNIPVAHVEAGLRSFNRRMPEEINRVLTDHLSSYLFAPTRTAVQNLNREGIKAEQIHLSGDVMLDLAWRTQKTLKQESLPKSPYALVTLHRAELVENSKQLHDVVKALTRLASDRRLIFPVHPRTRNAIQRLNLDLGAIECVEPLGYFEMIQMIAGSSLVITDSGGVQKEAYFLGKNCLTLRSETEWVELVEIGANKLIDDPEAQLLTAVEQSWGRVPVFDEQFYGDGR
ncbi:MAG: non-hydrolyzing UDP-N-acetylglucosamine 2-epimerase, partial [Bdellovibrionales bacterium]